MADQQVQQAEQATAATQRSPSEDTYVMTTPTATKSSPANKSATLESLTSSEWSQDAQPPAKRRLFNSPPSARDEDLKTPSPTKATPKAMPMQPPPGPNPPVRAAPKARAPPPAAAEPSKAALDHRLRRVMAPDAQGRYKVCKSIRDQWANIGTDRNHIYKLFAECQNDADRNLAT